MSLFNKNFKKYFLKNLNSSHEPPLLWLYYVSAHVERVTVLGQHLNKFLTEIH
jgi:hypothetical protein